MEIKEAIRCIIDGEAILFTGSGFSAEAIKFDGGKMRTAKQLSHELLDKCGYREEDYIDDLGFASDIFREKKGSLALADFIKKEFIAKDLTEEQKFLATLPWYRIYTTNYDNVLEKAWLDSGRHLNIAVLSDRTNDFQDMRSLCICLNGSLSKFSEAKLLNEFKLTNSSYLTDSFINSPWLNFFQTDLRTAKAIFFIGYSMQYDLDIQRIVFENEDLREKTFFIMWEKESRINVDLVKRFGQAFPIGMNAFMNHIKTEQKRYFVVKSLSHPLLCFDRVEVSKTIPEIQDKEAFDLFFRGYSDDWDKIYYSLKSPNHLPFFVYRNKLDYVIDAVKEGERNIVVHSSLGNGKTMFLKSLATLFSRNGYKVVYFRKYRSTLFREIEDICRESGPTVIFFDRYTDCIPYLETLKSFRQDQVLIVSDRSALNDIHYSRLTTLFGDFFNVDLNILEDDEIDQLCKILSRYALWANLSNLNDYQKKDFVTNKCNRSMEKTILKLLRSSYILNEFKTLITSIRSTKGYYDSLIYILISQVAGFRVDTDDLVNIFDASQLNSPSFRGDASVREFIDFEGNRVRAASSIFAQVLLEEIFDTGVIVDVMISIYKRLNMQRSRYEVRNVLKRMMNFSNLQHILNKKDKNYMKNLLHYYDSIHTLDFCAENPHFWMQYAILKLSEYDYQTADVYFDTAYAFAKKKDDFDTWQIDNHHARFILENEINFGSQVTCMKAFTEAHNVLMNTKHIDDSYYYPYRVAQNYFPFYERFYKGMNKNEKSFFISSCEAMLRRIEWYLSSTATKEGRRDVLKAQSLVTRILSEG